MNIDDLSKDVWFVTFNESSSQWPEVRKLLNISENGIYAVKARLIDGCIQHYYELDDPALPPDEELIGKHLQQNEALIVLVDLRVGIETPYLFLPERFLEVLEPREWE